MPLRQLHQSVALCFMTVAVAVLVYLPSLGNGFAWDDVRDVQDNTSVHGTQSLLSHLARPYRTDVPAIRSPYRPLTSMSFAISWQLGGGSPRVFHAMNVVLHALATALLFSLLLRFGLERLSAFLAATAFAVHPVHTEAVANVVGRADVLMTIFVLGAVLVYRTRTLPGPARAVGVWGLCALALLTKENGIALPPMILAVEVFGIGALTEGRSLSHRLRANAGIYVGLAGVVAAYLLLRYSVIGTLAHLDTSAYLVSLAPGERLTTAVANLGTVARLLLFPAVLAADYGPAVILPSGADGLRFWAGLVVGTVPIAIAFLTRRTAPWVGLSVAWVVLSFLVVSNLLFPVGIWLAERTLYLPSVGLSILIAGGLTALVRSGTQTTTRLAHVAIGLAIVAGAWQSWNRSPVWADSESVVLNLIDEHPESYRGQWWLAGRLVETGRLDEGLRWYRSAVDLNPNQALVVLDFARALILAGEAEEAESHLAPIPPGLHPSRSVYLAQSLVEQGDTAEALVVVREGLRLFPDDVRLQEQARQLNGEG